MDFAVLSDKQLMGVYAGIVSGARARYFAEVAEVPDMPAVIDGELTNACCAEMRRRDIPIW